MIIKKIAKAICEIPKFFVRTRQPRIIMTLLVKNEEAIIRQNLEFHKKMGIDGFVVTDNNSSDQTMAILKEYQQKGWILEIIEETSSGYHQKMWVDRMVCLAKDKYKADWVINADADEFWYAQSGALKNELEQTNANVLRCICHNMYPEEGKDFMQWGQYVLPVTNLEEYDLSPHAIYNKLTIKVAHRAAGYLQISMGNHKVKMLPQRTKTSQDIIIYHYPIRGQQQFVDKMVQGGKELSNNPQKHGGRHWRYFYNLYKENKLNEEYFRVIGQNSYDRLRTDGYIRDCKPLKDLM